MFSRRKEVAVVIPIYKPQMTAHEEISFDRCLKVLGHYPIILIAPAGWDLTNYLLAAPNAELRRFAASHFDSVQTYSRLLLNKSFYDRFVDYRYILLYQLDAFVLSDQLREWCGRGFDYIGAPWIDFPGMQQLASETGPIRHKFPRWAKGLNTTVGNGGFSLRRVRTFRIWLSLASSKARQWPHNEDGFWGFYAASFYPLFRVPRFELALRFAFELHPAKCFELNNRELPFGCHAWAKYDIEV